MTPPSSSPLGAAPGDRPARRPPAGGLAAGRRPAIAPDEVRIRVDRLNLDAASYRQLREAYAGRPGQDPRRRPEIIATRGKMQNPVTGSGGMLTGTVEEAGPRLPARPPAQASASPPWSPSP